jgi:hypothetical protein
MTPRLSVVVAGSRPQGPPEALFHSLRPLLQSGAAELLIATTRPDVPTSSPATRTVMCPPGSSIPALRLAGVRQACAPLVAVTEDFCAPVSGWAEALIAARDRVAAVAIGGPIARRGGGAADWALTLAEYGRFFRREPEGEVPDLPSINVAYDADRLRAVLPEDAGGLFETHVHARLRAQGGRFWRVPGAVMLDENVRPLRSAARAQYHHGRLFGGARMHGRPLLPRVVRVLMALAVPAVLLQRITREAGSAGHLGDVARVLPELSLLLSAWAAGEAAGSLLGEGRSGLRWM